MAISPQEEAEMHGLIDVFTERDTVKFQKIVGSLMRHLGLQDPGQAALAEINQWKLNTLLVTIIAICLGILAVI